LYNIYVTNNAENRIRKPGNEYSVEVAINVKR